MEKRKGVDASRLGWMTLRTLRKRVVSLMCSTWNLRSLSPVSHSSRSYLFALSKTDYGSDSSLSNNFESLCLCPDNLTSSNRANLDIFKNGKEIL